MAQRKSPGLRFRNSVYHIQKRICGIEIYESTYTSDLEEAEAYLSKRINEIRKAAQFGFRPRRTFREAATKYLEDNPHKAGITNFARDLRQLDSYIGDLYLDQVHDGTLAAYVQARRKAGVAPKTINLALGVVRRILNLSARKWRDENNLTWLETPPLLEMVPLDRVRKPYALSRYEESLLIQECPPHLQRMALFKVNTGCREQEVCKLRWEWEVTPADLGFSVFVIPAYIEVGDELRGMVKNREDRVVVLNSVARSIVEEQRGKHPVYVFVYQPPRPKGTRQCRAERPAPRPIGKINNSAWKTARRNAAARFEAERGLPAAPGFVSVRVHDLKHTFGRRLRAARVPLETRKVLLGHKTGDITTHYSAWEFEELVEAAEKGRSASDPKAAISVVDADSVGQSLVVSGAASLPKTPK